MPLIFKTTADTELCVLDFVRNKAPAIIKVESLNFIAYNFQQQGFADKSLKKWQKRKVSYLDSKSKSLCFVIFNVRKTNCKALQITELIKKHEVFR